MATSSIASDSVKRVCATWQPQISFQTSILCRDYMLLHSKGAGHNAVHWNAAIISLRHFHPSSPYSSSNSTAFNSGLDIFIPFLSHMNALSTAQRLPELTVRNIMFHYLRAIARSPPYFTSAGGLGCARFSALLPLLHVCRSWRAEAVKEFYQLVTMFLGQNRTLPAVSRRIPDISLATEGGCSQFVKLVSIHVHPRSIIDGTAAELLSKPPFKELALPNVTYLTVQTTKVSGCKPDETEGSSLFAHCIWRIFPNAVNTAGNRPTPCIDMQGWLNGEEYGKSDTSVAIFPNSLYTKILPGTTRSNSGLTSITLSAAIFSSPHFQLLHRNSQTLESIRLHGIQHNLCIRLIHLDDDSRSQVYSNMQHLELHVITPLGIFNFERAKPSGVPFPMLKKLICMPFYPFDNDVLFRRNQTTLESIIMPMDHLAAQALRDSPVLNEPYPNLDYVHMPVFWPGVRNLARQDWDEARNVITPAALKMSQNCRSFVLGLNGALRFRHLYSSLTQNHRFTMLKVFDICTLWMAPKEMLQMIQLLPTVQRLYVSLIGDNCESRKHMVPSDIEQKFGALRGVSRSNLCELFVMRFKRYTRWQLSERLLIATSMIPTIKHVSVHSHIDEDLVARVRRELFPGNL